MNSDVYTCPAANINPKPKSMNIVVRVLWKKFVFSFEPAGWGWAGGGIGFAGSWSENYVEVGYYIYFRYIFYAINIYIQA